MFNSSLMQVAVTHDLWLGRSVEGFLAREGIDAAGHIWCALLTFFFLSFLWVGGKQKQYKLVYQYTDDWFWQGRTRKEYAVRCCECAPWSETRSTVRKSLSRVAVRAGGRRVLVGRWLWLEWTGFSAPHQVYLMLLPTVLHFFFPPIHMWSRATCTNVSDS